MGLDLRRFCGLLMRLRRLRDVGLGRLILPGNDIVRLCFSNVYTEAAVYWHPLMLLSNEFLYPTLDKMYRD